MPKRPGYTSNPQDPLPLGGGDNSNLNPAPSSPTSTPPPGGFQAGVDKNMADYNDLFQGTPYFNTPGFQAFLQGMASHGQQKEWVQGYASNYADTFRSIFSNEIGREPTADEYNQFFTSVVNPQSPWQSQIQPDQLRQQTEGLLKQYYSGEAEKVAQGKAQDLTNQALAPGSPFDTWQQAYMKSIDDTSNALSDYQARLMEKIRPQLLTSLQAQGLLDSGALNEAFAGVEKDLSSAAQDYIAQARSGAAADIANQRYSIASNPGNMALSNAYGRIPNLTASGQQALQNVWGNVMQNNYSNALYNNQQRLLEQQYQNQPSLLSQYGGLILGGLAGGAGQALGHKAFA